jgi:hypothetical protein
MELALRLAPEYVISQAMPVVKAGKIGGGNRHGGIALFFSLMASTLRKMPPEERGGRVRKSPKSWRGVEKVSHS